VINKADRAGVEKAMTDLMVMLDMGMNNGDDMKWHPPVIKTVAPEGKGIEEVITEIERHRSFIIQKRGNINPRRTESGAREELLEMIKGRIMEEVIGRLEKDDAFNVAVESIRSGEKDPYTASDEILSSHFL
jgi:LAO/AO transport system kinase